MEVWEGGWVSNQVVTVPLPVAWPVSERQGGTPSRQEPDVHLPLAGRGWGARVRTQPPGLAAVAPRCCPCSPGWPVTVPEQQGEPCLYLITVVTEKAGRSA